jgi:putative transposase
MVRAGVVTHPSDWEFSGYNEIQNPRQRYGLINYKRLMQLLNIQTVEKLKKSHSGWIEEALRSDRHVRESKWVESVAVGSEEFVKMTKERLGFQVKGRSVSRSDEDYQLREQQSAYSAHFAPENALLSDDNTYFWSISDVI